MTKPPAAPTFTDAPNATPTAAAKPEPKTGTCPACEGTVPIRPGGRIADHNERIIRRGVEVPGDKYCGGSRQKPAAVES